MRARTCDPKDLTIQFSRICGLETLAAKAVSIKSPFGRKIIGLFVRFVAFHRLRGALGRILFDTQLSQLFN